MPIRKIKAGYCNLTAKVPSVKINRMADAESSLERDFLLILETDPNVTSFEEQPLTIEFVDSKDKIFSYTPDALVHYHNKPSILYEVKYRQEIAKNWFKLKPKFRAAIRFSREQAWRFKIVTEKEIRTPRLKNLEFLSHFSRTISPIESATRASLLDTLRELNCASPKEVLAACFSCKYKRAEAAPILWRLLFEGTIEADLNLPLTMLSDLTISLDVEGEL